MEEKENFKKKTKKILIISLSILLVLLIISLIYYLDKEHKEQIRLNNIKKEQEIINNISNHYNEYVITNKESTTLAKGVIASSMFIIKSVRFSDKLSLK